MALASLLRSQTNLELPEQVYPAQFLDCVCVCVCMQTCAGSCMFRQHDTNIFVQFMRPLSDSGHLLQFLQSWTDLFSGLHMGLWVKCSPLPGVYCNTSLIRFCPLLLRILFHIFLFWKCKVNKTHCLDSRQWVLFTSHMAPQSFICCDNLLSLVHCHFNIRVIHVSVVFGPVCTANV